MHMLEMDGKVGEGPGGNENKAGKESLLFSQVREGSPHIILGHMEKHKEAQEAEGAGGRGKLRLDLLLGFQRERQALAESE